MLNSDLSPVEMDAGEYLPAMFWCISPTETGNNQPKDRSCDITLGWIWIASNDSNSCNSTQLCWSALPVEDWLTSECHDTISWNWLIHGHFISCDWIKIISEFNMKYKKKYFFCPFSKVSCWFPKHKVNHLCSHFECILNEMIFNSNRVS